MNKIILSLIFVFIALMSIASVSACDMCNCTECDCQHIDLGLNDYSISPDDNLENCGDADDAQQDLENNKGVGNN